MQQIYFQHSLLVNTNMLMNTLCLMDSYVKLQEGINNNVIIVCSRNNITTNALLEPKLVLRKHVTLMKSKQVHVIKYNNYYEHKGILTSQ